MICEKICEGEYLIEFKREGAEYIVTYYVESDYIHIENIDRLNMHEIEKCYDYFYNEIKELICNDEET